MAFQLVIAEGKEAGREFVFEQESVLIGRTSDCDVVLYDPGVSRKHARIFSEAGSPGGYFVEDMGSSNGTKVNGAIIKKKQLADGDAISLGPVVFNFAGLSLVEDSTDHGAEPMPEGGGSTRIVAASDVQARRSKGKGAALVPDGVGEEQLAELSRSSTRTIQAVKEARKSQPGAKALSPRGNVTSNPGTPAVRRERASQPSAPALERAERASNPAGQQLSAAERARIRRQSAGPMAALKIIWAEASKTKRTIIAGSLSVVVLGMLGTAGYLAFHDDTEKRVLPDEPMSLVAGQPIEYSFGEGEGVDYPRSDQKVFDFEYKSPVRMVVVLHFQARDISANEVVMSVNGTDIGFVPPDTLAVNERSNEALVPPSALVRNAPNKIAFDNTKNPPGKDTWRIWNTWVEVFPLPELGREEMVKTAQENMRRGQDFWDRRSVGAENLYKAWRSFRESWLMLESVEGQKPMEYTVSRDKMREAQTTLDRLCSQLLLEAQSAYNQKQFEAARSTLEHVNEYFPKKDQPCPFRAEQMRDYYGI